MKLRKLENYTFLCSVFITFLPSIELYKLGTFVTGSVRRNRKFPPMLFGEILKLARKFFCKGAILAAAFREKGSLSFCQSTARQNIPNIFIFIMVNSIYVYITRYSIARGKLAY